MTIIGFAFDVAILIQLASFIATAIASASAIAIVDVILDHIFNSGILISNLEHAY